jgi:outer membrane protein assembly factor BamB
MIRPFRFLLLFVVTLGQPAFGADWPQFRGPDMAGISDETGLPDRWGPDENMRWSAALPGRGVSSPVVVGDRVFLTACSGLNQTRLHVFCFAADTGVKLWVRGFWATGPTNCNPKTCVAAPTPAADHDRIFAFFATGDLFCLDHAGNVRWLRTLQIEYPAMTNLVGRGASPVIHDGIVIAPMESQGESYLFGIDRETGRNRWKVERPLENSYTTPLLVRVDGRTDLIVQALRSLTAYDPATGTKRWEFADDSISTVASPAAADGLLLTAGRDMIALRPSSHRPPEVVWRSARLSSGTATPLASGGRVYALKDGGILACGDMQTGKEVWSQRLRGTYSASPVLAGGKLYLANEEGETTVLRLGTSPERVASNTLGGTMLATPAIARECVFLRTDGRLYCVGAERHP